MNFLANPILYEDMEKIFECGDYTPLKNRTVLVTGAYGMLASYMVYFMLYLNRVHGYGIKIASVSRSAEKLEARFGVYAPDITQITQSVTEPVDMACDYIVHAASFASPQYYTVSPVDVMLPNILGTYNLLESAFKNRAKVLYFSTCGVYGHFTGGRSIIAETDFGRIDPLDPHSCYDESKRAGEALCAAYFRQKGVPIVIARIAHTYGPTMDIDNDPRVFSSFVKNAVRGEDIEIKSDGLQRRSFCYISDATAAYFKLLLEGQAGEVYNVCNVSQTISMKELGEIVADLAGVDFVYKKRSDNDSYLQDKNADTALFSSEKLESLGFSFQVDAKQGFARTLESISFALNNPGESRTTGKDQ